MGFFITFEGGEGSGKTLQAKALYRKLMQAGKPAILTREPGGTEAGEKIARLLKQLKEIEMTPLTELLLFNASRAQHINQVIKPNLEFGKVVICDRYTDSTVTYQGYGRGLDMEMVKTVNDFATGGLKPDLTILMGIQAGIAINPETPVAAIAPLVKSLDSILFLSVNPGFYGAKFIPEVLRKIADFRKAHPVVEVGIDGGIKENNIAEIAATGVNVIYVGSAIYLQPDPAASYHRLTRLAEAYAS